MRRPADVIRAIAAAFASAVLLIGLPVFLITSVGWPLPRQLPNISGIVDTITGSQPLESTTVWKILACILWVAWLQVVVAYLVEVISVVRGSLPRSLPGLNLAHGLVAPLVATIVLAWPVSTAPRAGASQAATSPAPARAPVTAAPRSAATTADPTNERAQTLTEHTVVRRETLWDLAERYLGNGYRASEIFELNQGRPQPDGSTLTDPSLIRPGWILQIPATTGNAQDTVTVQPGDTLWELATDHLGDGHRFAEIADLNRDRPQPDGRALHDASLIEPGWVLDLPAIERGDQPPAPQAASAPPVIPPPAPPPAPEPEPAPAPGTAPVPTTAAASTPTSIASGSAGGVDAHSDSRDGSDESNTSLPRGLLGGGVATAGVLAVLQRRRRAQLRQRAPGHVPPPLSPELNAADVALRAGADVTRAAAIDRITRAAAAGSGATGLAPIARVDAGDNAMSLSLDSPAPPPPGFTASNPARWEAADSQPPITADCAAPAPTLVAVGRTAEGAEVLIDLEHPAVTMICGAEDEARGLANAVALAVASAPWSDHARVLVVETPTPPLDDLEEVASLAEALDQLEAHATRVAEALDAARCNTLAQARAAGMTPDLWAPTVAIVATQPTEDELARIGMLSQRSRGGVALVALSATDTQLGRTLHVTNDGRASIDDGEPFAARFLSREDVRAVTDLLEHAAQDCVEQQPTSSSGAAVDSTEDATSVLHALMSELDVLVRVLGDVETVRASDGERLDVPKQKSLEAIAYLSLRESRVDREDLQAALWPSGANSPKTFHNTIWAARKMLGQSRDGAELVPEPIDGHYLLSERVGTDYALFHELTARAEETDDALRAADLLASALTLVRAEPFTGAGRGYAWVAPHAGLIVAQVVDAAEELAEMRLAAGDWRGAEWAARQGLRVFPCEERLYRLLMRAAHAAGSVPGVHRAFQELAAAVADPDDGVEPDDTVHPDTIALLDELTRRPDRASA
jgi:DNA-binding SARP family transcriptional activator/LysM repeat protein